MAWIAWIRRLARLPPGSCLRTNQPRLVATSRADFSICSEARSPVFAIPMPEGYVLALRVGAVVLIIRGILVLVLLEHVAARPRSAVA
jgi:hypothetical protein